MKNIFSVLMVMFVLLLLVIVIRTMLYVPEANTRPVNQLSDSDKQMIDPGQLSSRLSQAIGFKTISLELESTPEHPEFEQFYRWLETTYTQVFQTLSVRRLGKYSVLVKWPGKDNTRLPVLLSAHYDVVPVITNTESLWEHPPYSGYVDKTYVWGRGALDDKSAVITLMEAATLLLSQEFKPGRDVYFALTHDEEIGGDEGTAAIVKTLEQEGVTLDWSLDEGSFLLKGFFPGVDVPLASINVAEKGYLTVDLVATTDGGHSSMPPRETAIGILANALVKLQENPVPGGLDGQGALIIDVVGRHLPFFQRILFANRWLFGGLIEAQLSKDPATNALLRTTTAPTMLSAGIKDNVLAITATGAVNFRLHPRDTIQSTTEFVESIINDGRVSIVAREGIPASQISSHKAPGYLSIAETVQAVYGNVVVASGMTIAATDSRRYEAIANNSYRFNPMILNKEDSGGFHGTNERISIDNLVAATQFYMTLIRGTSR